MRSIRRSLRLWVAIWLAFEAASLSALVPRDCCAAHRPAAPSAAEGCHESAAAVQCPMRAADGTPCPMHRDRHGADTGAPEDRCAMRGACTGPMAALFAQLSTYGVLTDAYRLHPDFLAGPVATAPRERPVTRLAPPDAPPPRA